MTIIYDLPQLWDAKSRATIDLAAQVVGTALAPYTGLDANETQGIVDGLEAQGFIVHWPPRDTDQDDETGYRICTDNLNAIAAADVVHIVWDGKSQGCLFDLGMAFALNKTIIPILLPDKTEGKSFQNMVTEWAGQAD